MEEYDLVEVALCCANKGSMALHGYLHPESSEDNYRKSKDDLCATVRIDILLSFSSECEM